MNRTVGVNKDERKQASMAEFFSEVQQWMDTTKKIKTVNPLPEKSTGGTSRGYITSEEFYKILLPSALRKYQSLYVV